MTGKILYIIGKMACGKTRLLRYLLYSMPKDIEHSVLFVDDNSMSVPRMRKNMLEEGRTIIATAIREKDIPKFGRGIEVRKVFITSFEEPKKVEGNR